MEAVQRDDFHQLPVVPADFIREHHGVYSGGSVCKVDVWHCVSIHINKWSYITDNHIMSLSSSLNVRTTSLISLRALLCKVISLAIQSVPCLLVDKQQYPRLHQVWSLNKCPQYF